MDPSRRPSATPTPRRMPFGDATSKANSQAGPPRMGNLTDAPKRGSENRPSAANNRREPRIPTLAVRPPLDNHRASTTSQGSASSHPPRKTHIGPWQLGKTIGEGGTCLVRQVRHSKNGTIAVAKIINKATAEKVRARSLANLLNRVEDGDYRLAGKFNLPVGLEREIAIMRLLKHPNIARLYDVWENRNEIYLIMEYVDGGELFAFLAKESPIAEREAIYLFRQLVDAVVYCHRMQIYHRDLKPENILLSREPFAVKLIDFGMSAFQPNGESLKTPCGSPHYAAPELLHGMPYDGSKTDVWSLAVILFVMLTGDPPFNHRQDPNQATDAKLQYLYNLIKAAKVKIPASLSDEAKDLFRKVFVADPARRIDLDELWKHPLLHKYDRHHGLDNRSWRDASPNLTSWKPLTKDTIDSNIFRSLLTLWHDSDEKLLIKNLCNKTENQEKLFYMALAKYHEDQRSALEQSPLRGLVPSRSDHHHSHFSRISVRRPNKSSHKRSGSKFSVYHEEHLSSKHSFFDDTPSQEISDPFHASVYMGPMSSHTILETPPMRPTTSRGKAPANPQVKGSLRVEVIKRQNSKRLSAFSKRSKASVGRLSVGSRHSRTLSHASTASIQRSPAPVVASRRHKRNVSFHHPRYGPPIFGGKSTGLIDIPRSDSPLLPASPNGSTLYIPSSPPTIPGSIHPIKRAYLPLISQTPRTRTLKVIELEARRVSNELGKACEEAFFRSSFSEKSDQSSASDAARHPSETPPSSISNASAAANLRKGLKVDKSILNRPLPPTPKDKTPPQAVETPHTYTARQLQEMRQRLAARYAQEANPDEHFNAVLRQLDSLMPLENERHHGGYVINQSFLNSNTDFLQSIPEEGRGQNSDECFDSSRDTVLRHNISTDYVSTQLRHSGAKEGPTIRIVEPSSPASPSPWLPLNIRKTSDSSNRSSIEPSSGMLSGKHEANDNEHTSLLNDRPNKEHAKSRNSSRIPWWRRVSQPRSTGDKSYESNVSPGVGFADLDDRIGRRDQQMGPVRFGNVNQDQSLELPQNPPQAKRKSQLRRTSAVKESSSSELDGYAEQKLPRIRGWFRKRPKTIYNIERESPLYSQKQSSGMIAQAIPVAKASTPEPKAPGEWNLLQRIFRTKPEARVVVMKQARPAARTIICAFLIQGQADGDVCDLLREPGTNFSYTGRLAADNRWNLKPVSFAVELFNILVNGSQSRLTAVRVTQTRGYGPSIRKLADILSTALAGYLHQDTKESKQIAQLLLTGRADCDLFDL